MARFTFDGLTLETARPTDELLSAARAWTLQDPDHRDTTPPEFWFEQRAGRESYVLQDSSGLVFFFKLQGHATGEVEMHIQFPPPIDLDQRARILRGLTKGLCWIERALAFRQVHTLFFVSKSATLIRFCETRLGFKANGNRLEKQIPAAQ